RSERKARVPRRMRRQRSQARDLEQRSHALRERRLRGLGRAARGRPSVARFATHAEPSTRAAVVPPGWPRAGAARYKARVDRVPERELMDGVEQARAYADADFSEPHDRFVALFRARFPDAVPRRVLDLGCGPCDVTRRFARGHPGCAITALDGSRAMLDEARRRNRDAGFADRIEL